MKLFKPICLNEKKTTEKEEEEEKRKKKKKTREIRPDAKALAKIVWKGQIKHNLNEAWKLFSKVLTYSVGNR